MSEEEFYDFWREFDATRERTARNVQIQKRAAKNLTNDALSSATAKIVRYVAVAWIKSRMVASACARKHVKTGQSYRHRCQKRLISFLSKMLAPDVS